MSLSFAAGTPHPSLRGVVLRYEGYSQRSPGPVMFRELPCTFVPIIIDRPVMVGHRGSARCLQVDYFDQAHLAREVRELADITPTELRAKIVNSVQDGGARPA